MLKKNGFTVIELIMSFIFASILSFALLSTVLYYRDKEIDTSIQANLLEYKSNLLTDIQTDIQKYVLRSMNYCKDENDNIINRCVELKFENGLVKIFKIDKIPYVDTLYDDEGRSYDFNYDVSYISYGGIAYKIPDAPNVTIISDYMLQSTSLYDGIETSTPLYKLRVRLTHEDLDADIDISIVANGTENLAAGVTPYPTYAVGDRISIQLSGSLVKYFRVIENSGMYSGVVTLLYDDADLSTTVFSGNNSKNYYENSSIKNLVDQTKTRWINAREVRLPYAEEISHLSGALPTVGMINEENINLNGANTQGYGWLLNSGDYWTMSPAKYSSESYENDKVWYVDGSNKLLRTSLVSATHKFRPVITIEKRFINN